MVVLGVKYMLGMGLWLPFQELPGWAGEEGDNPSRGKVG